MPSDQRFSYILTRTRYIFHEMISVVLYYIPTHLVGLLKCYPPETTVSK